MADQKTTNERNIGKLARFAGVSPYTIKYYEKIGLIETGRDEHSNYRRYDLRICTVLGECLRYRGMGFSLKELDTLIKSAESGEQQEMIERRLSEIEAEIARLQDLREYAKEYVKECRRVEEELGEWYLEAWEGVTYCRMQTKGLTFTEAHLGDDPVNMMDYAPRTTGVLVLSKEYLEGGPQDFFWGQSLHFRENRPEFEGKREFIRLAPKKVFVAFRKYTGSYAAGGEMAEDLRWIYRQYRGEFTGDAYAFRIKIVHDEQGVDWHYFKIVVPVK